MFQNIDVLKTVKGLAKLYRCKLTGFSKDYIITPEIFVYLNHIILLQDGVLFRMYVQVNILKQMHLEIHNFNFHAFALSK